ncbi:protein CNPPD1-like protein [Dinothrombium tinctorium]|uniref:Protein CNPPD1-like protein n=1 Tax=Dinothrombium tinctorium TaxID=1965070 RepID=A0A443RCM0_9ACAR|nr:protein CNPPD1-like protein [Dinothrombium tinctorium]
MSTSFSAIHVQKMKLEKLMQNIDKEVEIPERVQERKFPEPPDFIRNIMGSSAGAGSGEFHVYRHLRRKEFARQRFIEEQAKKEELDVKYRQKLEENMKIAEEKTAKKRAKRLKKKARKKIREKNGAAVGTKKSVDETSEEEDESDSEKPKEESEEHKATMKRTHVAFTHRLRKSLYCSPNAKHLTDISSLPLTEVSVDLIEKAVKRRTENGLKVFDTDYASRVSRKACVSPCSLMIALIYVERIKLKDPEYLRKVSPCDLFLVSLMVASKYLFDDGEEEEVLNEEWADFGNTDLKALNKLEAEFLNAIDWDLFVDPTLFFQWLSLIEVLVVKNECRKRCWNGLSYSEVLTLLDNASILENLKSELTEYFVKVMVITSLTYTALIFSIVGCVAARITLQDFLVNHLFLDKTSVRNQTSFVDTIGSDMILEKPLLFSDYSSDHSSDREVSYLSVSKISKKDFDYKVQTERKGISALTPDFSCPHVMIRYI